MAMIYYSAIVNILLIKILLKNLDKIQNFESPLIQILFLKIFYLKILHIWLATKQFNY